MTVYYTMRIWRQFTKVANTVHIIKVRIKMLIIFAIKVELMLLKSQNVIGKSYLIYKC